MTFLLLLGGALCGGASLRPFFDPPPPILSAYPCPGCRSSVPTGISPCPSCGAALTWPERALAAAMNKP